MDCLVYPFSEGFIPYEKCIKEFRTDLHITKYVCPAFWKININETDNYPIETNFDAAMEAVAAVMICECQNINHMYRDIIQKIKSAVKNEKTVFCCVQLKAEDLDEIKSMKEYRESDFQYLADYPLIEEKERELYDEQYEVQECVVIGVGRMLRGVNTDTTFCNMIRKYRSLGYSVVGVGTNYNCRMMGCYIFPDNVFSSLKNEEDKVLFINTYINKLQIKQCADIVLVQFPDGMMQYSNRISEGYGIKSFMVSRALFVDYFILNIPQKSVEMDNFTELNQTFKYRYGFEIDAVGIDNKEIDVIYSNEMDEMNYKITAWRNTSEYAKECEENCSEMIFFSIDQEIDYDRVVSDSVEKLSSNVEEF